VIAERFTHYRITGKLGAGYEIEDVLTIAEPKFWEMIEGRRKSGQTRNIASVRERFARKDARAARKRSASRKKTPSR